MSVDSGHGGLADEAGRRDFLFLLTGALGAVGVGAAIWPFIASMNPSADVLAAGAPLDVDLTPVQPGQQLLVVWQGRPVFIVRRTPAQLKLLQDPKEVGLLSDPQSTVMQQPPYARNWHRSIEPEWLVVVGICTHLGCIPEFRPTPGGDLGGNWPGGYFCPCHGSRYDLSARVFSGVPAPYNLPVPPYRFTGKTALRVGENPPQHEWDFASIEQI
jgi:ubiquinol-cytochrome c reductase iron-sulfur subunit